MKTKLSPRFWCALTLFSLIGQVAWVVENMYFNVFIYKMFNASASDISAMVAASAVAATLTTVLMGALSDRVGKRRLFICGGYILWGISIFSFVLLRIETVEKFFPMAASAASVGVSLVIIMDCVMTFFGSTANDAAFNAWLTDSTDSTNRGAVEGINAMMPLVAILAVFGGFMAFDLSNSSSWVLIFTIIGAAVFVVGILGFFLIKDPDIKPTATGCFKNIFYGFRPSTIRENPVFYIALGVFALFNISIQIFMPYLILYYEVSLKMTNYVFVMAPAIIIASVVTAFWGKVYDKKGFSFASMISLLWLCLGYIVLLFTKATAFVFIGSLLMMCGYLAGMAVFGAVIRDHTPKGKSGMFQGLRIFAQVLIPGVIGPYIGSAVLSGAEQILNNDGTTSFVPNANIFLAALIVAVVLIPFTVYLSKKRTPRTVELETPWECKVGEIPWSEYPRPQLERDSYLCLNGKWKISVKNESGETARGDILVPFPPESHISGVGFTPKKGEKLVYRRTFSIPDGFVKDRLFLHFGACDQIAQVFINDICAGTHEGGYLPFSFDITEYIKDGENSVRVVVTDDLDTDYPYGKQRRNRGGMWYTPVSGIWQTVWLESVCSEYIENIRITPDLTGVLIEVEGGTKEKTVTLDNGESYTFSGKTFRIDVCEPKLWSPENPYLYRFSLTSGDDTVKSYFALRTVEVNGKDILLNGKPYFFNGLLDQGYFSDGIYLPASPEGYEYDVLKMKELGFNMLRKHIKIEPEAFYYYCDTHGMIVFQDIVNSGEYSFIVDTALPTIGMKKGVTHKAGSKRNEIFEISLKGTLSHLYNHPCIMYYTLFNEGWGQYDTQRLYELAKSIDATRIWDTASGWFEGAESDVESRHIYFKPVKLNSGDKPLVLSEFGGYSCRVEGHIFNLDNNYGYRIFGNCEALTDAIVKLYREEIIPAVKNNGLCATVLTQVSDVEDETNGLVTYDRHLVKVDGKKINCIMAEVFEAFENK